MAAPVLSLSSDFLVRLHIDMLIRGQRMDFVRRKLGAKEQSAHHNPMCLENHYGVREALDQLEYMCNLSTLLLYRRLGPLLVNVSLARASKIDYVLVELRLGGTVLKRNLQMISALVDEHFNL